MIVYRTRDKDWGRAVDRQNRLGRWVHRLGLGRIFYGTAGSESVYNVSRVEFLEYRWRGAQGPVVFRWETETK